MKSLLLQPAKTADISLRGFLAKWRLKNKRRNSILTMHSTQILVVLLIDWKFSSTKQKYKPDLGSGASSVWNFCTHFRLRCYVAGKPVVTIRNDGCFLRLLLFKSVKIISYLPNIEKNKSGPVGRGIALPRGHWLALRCAWSKNQAK